MLLLMCADFSSKMSVYYFQHITTQQLHSCHIICELRQAFARKYPLHGNSVNTCEQSAASSWKYPRRNSQYSRVVMTQWPWTPTQHGRPAIGHVMWRFFASFDVTFSVSVQICTTVHDNTDSKVLIYSITSIWFGAHLGFLEVNVQPTYSNHYFPWGP